MSRVLSIEDKDTNTPALVTARTINYTDIDLSFAKRPSGDIYKKTDAAAVKQSVKNIVATNRLEKPFNDDFGADITSLLFELANDETSQQIRQNIDNAIYIYEPRAEVLNIDVSDRIDTNTINVTVTFKVVSTEEVVTLTSVVSRLR